MWKKTRAPRLQSPASSPSWFVESADYLRRSLRRLGVPNADLEDALQEALIVVHRKQDDYDASRPLKPWLFGFALRVAANHRRKARAECAADHDLLASSEPSPERRALVSQALAITRQALDRMSAERSVIFSLHDLEGLSAPEIAELVSAPTNTVYSRLRAARAEFAQAVSELTAIPLARA